MAGSMLARTVERHARAARLAQLRLERETILSEFPMLRTKRVVGPRATFDATDPGIATTSAVGRAVLQPRPSPTAPGQRIRGRAI